MSNPFKYLWVLFFTLLYLLPLKSQEQSHILVLNNFGNVQILNNNEESKVLKVMPGMQIDLKGELDLESESQIKFIYKGRLHTLDGPIAFDLPSLANEGNNEESSGFLKRFWHMVGDGLTGAASPQHLEKYAHQYMGAAFGAVKGYGEGEYTILPVTPLGGQLFTDKVKFSWTVEKPQKGKYLLTIRDQESNDIIFKTKSRQTSKVVNLAKIGVNNGQTIVWEIDFISKRNSTIKAQGKMRSMGIELILVGEHKTIENKVSDLLGRIADEPDTLDKEWMKAIVYEELEFNHHADEIYREMRRKNPNNLLVAKLYASFLARHGLQELAIEQIAYQGQ